MARQGAAPELAYEMHAIAGDDCLSVVQSVSLCMLPERY